MDRVVGRDSIVFRANRWLVGIVVLAASGAGLLLLQPMLLDFVRLTNFRARGMAFIGLVPPDIRVLAIQAVALALIAVGLVFCRFLADPRMVTVNENGIEVREYLRTRRGRWRDFSGMRPARVLGLKTIEFQFRKAQGFSTRVTLPTPPLAIDNRALVGTVAEWIMENKVPLQAGFLDKYDPKKLNALAAAAAEKGEPAPVAAFVPAAQRTFGKRTAA